LSEDNSHGTRHSLNDVWGAIGKQSDDIATIRAGQAALEARVTHGFTGISQQLEGLFSHVNRPPPQQDVKGWIAVAISIVLALGAIGWSNLQPVKDVVDTNTSKLRELQREVFYSQGRNDALHEGINHRLNMVESGTCR
jgi:hypothetical protein